MTLRMTDIQVWIIIFFNIGFLAWFASACFVFLLAKKTPLLSALFLFFVSQFTDRIATLLILLNTIRVLPDTLDQPIFWIRVTSYILMSYAFVGLSYTLIKPRVEELLRQRPNQA